MVPNQAELYLVLSEVGRLGQQQIADQDGTMRHHSMFSPRSLQWDRSQRGYLGLLPTGETYKATEQPH